MLVWTRTALPASAALLACPLSFIILLSSSAPATAGQGAAAPAGIIGQVTDGTGAALPGVTVAAMSPALQVPSVVTVTDARGEYRLTPLPIGLYTVTYELVGFQGLRRENVRLTVGFVARVDQVLNLGTLAETITVSGASPLVDVTSTATRTELTREALEILPTTRDGLKAFMGQVPGLRTNLEVGTGGLSEGVQFRAYGQTGDSWQMLEGVLASSPSSPGRSGSHMDFNSIEGTRVQTVGSNAEMPRRGILLDAVVKSGGNNFHGDIVGYGSSGALEGTNVDQGMRDLGLTGLPALHSVRDFSANVGGRIIPNKLWFYVGGRYEGLDREILDAFHPDGTPIVLNTYMIYHVEKLSFQMTPANRFTGFYHFPKDFQRRGASKFVPADSRHEFHSESPIGKVEWQAVRGTSLVTSLQYGTWDLFQARDGLTDNVATTDIATLYVTGASTNDGSKPHHFRRHTKGVVSWYRPDLLAGNHEFKAGVDYLYSESNSAFRSRSSGNYQLQFNNGAPFQIATYNYPVQPQNSDKYVGVYAQDAWTVARRLTLNLGLRFAHDNAYAPPQCRDAADFAGAQCWDKIQMNIWNSVAPRLRAAFDVFGDGKTVIKGGWGRFDRLREIDPELTGTSRNVASTTIWTWRDLNGNRAYEPGEVNLNPNGTDFRSISGTTLGVVNPDEKQGKADEFSVTVEREVMANWAVRLSGVYSRNFNVTRLVEISRPYDVYNIPITNPDPGRDGRVGTGDDPGTFITYYDYPASLTGAAFAQTMRIDDPRADTKYKTIEVASSKRLSQGWQLSASYTATKSEIPFGSGTPALALNPNAETFSANNTWEWQTKISGAYTFPYGIIASANYDYRSGEPQARQVLFTGGRQVRSIVLNVEPIGSLRLPSTNLVDVRASKRSSLGAGRSLELRADVFNVLNANTVTSRILRSGSTFLLPAEPGGSASGSIVLPRILQLGVSYSF